MDAAAIRSKIRHPALRDAFDADWYWPLELTDEHKKLAGVKRAIKEGWAEWIETEEDIEAIRKGYVYDLSTDKNGRIVYWYKGRWVRYASKVSNRLVDIEESEIGHVGSGDHACRFAELFLKHTKDPLRGDPYRFIHWQRKVALCLFGWVRMTEDAKGRAVRYRRYLEAMLEVSKKNAKLLADDTPIPTPTGWKNHGDLQVGDELFDSKGNIVQVVAVHPKCVADLEVEFSNGDLIRCNGEHRWVTESLLTTEPYRRGSRKHKDARAGGYYTATVKTTDDIAGTLWAHNGRALSHRMKMHDGIECKHVELPVDPYVLGYWLGDGSSYRADITVGANVESELCELFAECGMHLRKRYEQSGKINVTFDFKPSVLHDDNGFSSALRKLNLYQNKHIPEQYLRASKQQRMALLQGLLDSDGTISKCGKNIVLSQKNIAVANGLAELLASLGIKYRHTKKVAVCTNNGKSATYNNIQFHAFRDEHQCFRLSAKLNRMRSRSSLEMRTGRSRHVHFKAIRPIEPVSGNCITVSGDGTYLCGRTMLSTHNSDFSSVIAVILMRADHTTKAFVYGAASDRNQARIIFNEARDYVKNAIQLPEEIEITDSKSKMVHWESGSTYEVISADAYRNDGYDAHGVLFDELHQQPNRALFAVMKKAGLARPQPLRIVTTTYGKSLSANTGKFTSGNIWAEEHLKTKAQLEGKRSNYRRFNMVASAEPIPVVVTQAAEAGATRLAVHRLQQPIDIGEEIEIELSEAVGGLRSVTVKLTQPAKRYQWHIDVEPVVCNIPQMSEGQANHEPLLLHRIDHAIRRANPSIGITLELDRVRSEILDAVGPQATAEAMQLCLNIVSGGGRTWLSGASWAACGKKRVLPSAIIGQRCIGGFDVSLTTDLTSFWLAFPNWKVGTKFGKVQSPLIRLAGLVWVAGEEIERREAIEEVPYRAFAEMKYMGRFGYVRICPGPAIDYRQVGEDILEFCEQFKVQAIGYDPAYADLVVGAFLQPGGLKCVPHRQGGVSMGPPTKRFENMVKHGQIMHGNHPLLNLAIEGAVLETPDKVGNTYPSKGKSTTRIDPLMAAVMAVGWACDPPQEARSSGAWSGEVGSGIFG